MEIIIKIDNHNTRHKYFDNEQEAQDFYNEAIKEYGKDNVFMPRTLSKFYI